MKNILLVIFIISCSLSKIIAQFDSASRKTAAVYVANRLDQSKTQYQSIFLDYLTASLSNVGLQLITPEDQVKGITTLRQNPSSTNGANTLAE